MNDDLKKRVLEMFPFDKKYAKEFPHHVDMTQRLIDLDEHAIEAMADYYLRNEDKLDSFISALIYAIEKGDKDVMKNVYARAVKIRNLIELYEDLRKAYHDKKNRETDNREEK